MADDEHEHEDGHDHPQVKFEKSEVDEATLVTIRALHPALADDLILSRRFAELSDDDKRLLIEAQSNVEAFREWAPGYHAKGDRCVTCGMPTEPLFTDRFAHGKLEYAPMVHDLPVHARRDCIDGVAVKVPKPSPQALDKVRREHTLERSRPTAHMVLFFRHDFLTHPPFALEDWAESVVEANNGKLDKTTMRDMERLMHYVHQRLFH